MEKQTPSRHRHQTLALVLLTAILLSCGLTWWLHTPSGHAAGFYLEKTRYRLFSPYYLPDPLENGRSDVFGLRFEEEGDLEKAKQFMPEMMVPGYIPEGWAFQNLEIVKALNGKMTAEYSYQNHENHLFSINEIMSESDEGFRYFQEGEPTQLKKRKVNRLFDPVTEILSLEFYQEQLMVIISGEIDEENLKMIADDMK